MPYNKKESQDDLVKNKLIIKQENVTSLHELKHLDKFKDKKS